MKPSSQDILLQAYFEKRVLLVRYFTRLTGEPTLAEDIVQDLYLKVSAIDTTPALGDPVAFLFKMAHNIRLNQLRSNLSSRNRDRAWHEVSALQMGDDTVDDSPSAEAQADGRQQIQQLQKALNDLPEKTRTIFRLHKLEGLSQTDVATRLDISLSSVEKHLSTALRHLAARLHRGSGP